jgi:LacI family transcriptional regulator
MGGKKQSPRSRPTIKEVAERANVALSSVSRVLNEHPDVSYEMRERVTRAIHDLGYEPNLIASSLRSGSTRTIGFVVANVANPLFADITRGAARRLEEAGFSMVLTNSDGEASREERMIRLLRWRQVDGLIVALADEHRRETLQELAQHETPVVLLDRETPEVPSTSAVICDHATGVSQAVDLLFELGHRRIGFVSVLEAIRPGRERLRGYLEGHAKREVDVPRDLIRLGPLTPGFAEEAVGDLMSIESPPTALVVASNVLLVGGLRALHRMGIPVGDRVSLVSCDDIPLGELHSPPITVVDRDRTRMGEMAAELLIERIQNPEVGPRTVTLPTQLVVRSSTAALG